MPQSLTDSLAKTGWMHEEAIDLCRSQHHDEADGYVGVKGSRGECGAVQHFFKRARRRFVEEANLSGILPRWADEVPKARLHETGNGICVGISNEADRRSHAL